MKLGILICTYNRPQYLQQCLESVERSDISKNTPIVIVDDNSYNKETIQLIHDFPATKVFKQKNKSIKDSLLIGCEILFEHFKCDTVTNLDSDAVIAKNFCYILTNLAEKFPEHIITGFNCLTKNRDGSERHKIISQGVGWNKKKSVGGINMLFDQTAYLQWVKPTLIRCLETQGNWDHQTCIASMGAGKEIVCAVPSVVQHIGIESSMGHATSEPPDVADDFIYDAGYYGVGGPDAPLFLPQIMLTGADGASIRRLMRAAEICKRHIQFGAVKLFSRVRFSDPSVQVVGGLENKSEYSDFMIKTLGAFIPDGITHVLVIQHDGFILNPSAWRDEWLQYDYIGAPWNWYPDHRKVGNGGFSLRSTRLQKILRDDPNIVAKNDPGVTRNKEEDHCICRLYRDYLEEKYQIKFAPIEEAKIFSIEGWRTENPTWTNEFGFHGRGVDISKSGMTI